jgi:hypothetical protein
MAPRLAAALGLVLAASLVVPATAATPKAGSWSGDTRQDKSINFKVTPGGEKVKKLKVGFKGTCDNGATVIGQTKFGGKFDVEDGKFTTGSSGNTKVKGNFTSRNHAKGTLKHTSTTFDPFSLRTVECRSGKVRWTADH